MHFRLRLPEKVQDIPDCRHDPYGKVKFAYRGHDKSLHLAPFFCRGAGDAA